MSQPTRLETVAPGVYRFADPLVNVYVIDEGGALTVVDAAMPGVYGAFVEALRTIGRSVADIKAVLITHGHPDHIGMAHRLHADGVPVWVHRDDQVLLAQPSKIMKNSPGERSVVRYLTTNPRAVAVPWHLGRTGGFRERGVAASVFDGEPYADGSTAAVRTARCGRRPVGGVK